MSTACPHLWGGEGTETRTAGWPAMHVWDDRRCSVGPAFKPGFDSLADSATMGNLDAPGHIARGGVIAFESSVTGWVLFASEPRP